MLLLITERYSSGWRVRSWKPVGCNRCVGSNPTLSAITEWYSRGWRGRFAKSLGWVTGARVRIPPAPPLWILRTAMQFFFISMTFPCTKTPRGQIIFFLCLGRLAKRTGKTLSPPRLNACSSGKSWLNRQNCYNLSTESNQTTQRASHNDGCPVL